MSEWLELYLDCLHSYLCGILPSQNFEGLDSAFVHDMKYKPEFSVDDKSA